MEVTGCELTLLGAFFRVAEYGRRFIGLHTFSGKSISENMDSVADVRIWSRDQGFSHQSSGHNIRISSSQTEKNVVLNRRSQAMLVHGYVTVVQQTASVSPSPSRSHQGYGQTMLLKREVHHWMSRKIEMESRAKNEILNPTRVNPTTIPGKAPVVPQTVRREWVDFFPVLNAEACMTGSGKNSKYLAVASNAPMRTGLVITILAETFREKPIPPTQMALLPQYPS